jgi:hypothetical protein
MTTNAQSVTYAMAYDNDAVSSRQQASHDANVCE